MRNIIVIYIIHEIFIQFILQGFKPSRNCRVSLYSEIKFKRISIRQAFLYASTNESTRPGHCVETDELRANVHTASLRVHVNLLVSVLTRISDYETAALQGRRRQQMAGAFCASAHFPRTLSSLFLSLSLLLSSLVLRGFLVSRVKFTNPYGAPRVSNEPASLSLYLIDRFSCSPSFLLTFALSLLLFFIHLYTFSFNFVFFFVFKR